MLEIVNQDLYFYEKLMRMEKKNFVLDHVLYQSLFIWKYLYEKLLFFKTQKKN